ncbi:MAG TPA: amino acid--tRNA ligase-related protein [Patescibacteria group bacterium]|nr:amino acid--tRNA ligase-related protein [Patescibacteria group bacterium]
MNITTTITHLPYYRKYLLIENALHAFFEKKKYLRLHLPVLSPVLIPESYMEVFKTEFQFIDKKKDLFLTPSPELFIKRLLAEGVGDCYTLTKAFRNSEPSSSLHNVEFTMLEFYKVHADYTYLKKETAELFSSIAEHILGKNSMKVRGKQVIFSDSWEEISVAVAFKRYADIDRDELFNHKLFFKKAKQKKYSIEKMSYEDVFSIIYTQEIEPHLGIRGTPTIIYDYPKEMAALAQLNSDGVTAQRFEFYVSGIELGDAYTELTDWKEQKKRFLIEEKKRKEMGKITHPTDWSFVDALKKGLPPCTGMAIGFDRMAMIFAGCDDIGQMKLINST